MEALGVVLNRANSEAPKGLRLMGELAFSSEARYPLGERGWRRRFSTKLRVLTRGDLSASAVVDER